MSNSEVISFSYYKKIFLPSEVIPIKIKIAICANQYRIRGFSDGIRVSTYDTHDDRWLSPYASWVAYPIMTDHISLKIENVINRKVPLKLQLQNVQSSEIYEYSLGDVWVTDAYEGYVSKLNSNILALVTAPNPVLETEAFESSKIVAPINKSAYFKDKPLLYFAIVLFIIFVVLMLKYLSDYFKNSKKLVTGVRNDGGHFSPFVNKRESDKSNGIR